MRSESGVTLVEVTVALAVIALMTSLAMLSGSAIIRSGQASRAASRLLDHIAIARMSAVAETREWRIRFDDPTPPGSAVVQGYTVESCPVNSCATWTEEDTYELQDGLGIQVLFNGGKPIKLQFNPDGFYSGPTTEISICQIQVNPGGIETCKSGSAGRTIRIHGNTGVIEH